MPGAIERIAMAAADIGRITREAIADRNRYRDALEAIAEGMVTLGTPDGEVGIRNMRAGYEVAARMAKEALAEPAQANRLTFQQTEPR